jgi:hypothetical protein
LHGDEKTSRYDTLVYLNNLSLSMEAMVDKKIQLYQPTFQNVSVSAVSAEAIVDLKNEVAALKLELATLKDAVTNNMSAIPAAAPRESANWSTLLKDNLVIDSYYFYGGSATTGNDTLAAARLFTRADLKLGRDFGLSGFEFTLKRNYTSAAAWAGRELSDFARVRFEASAGPGQVIDQDRRVGNNPANALGVSLGLWDLSLSAAQSHVSDNIVAPNGVLLDVNRQTLSAKFDFSLGVPLFSVGNIFYQADTYSGEGHEFSGETVRAFTARALSGLHFDFAERQFLTLLYLQYIYKNDCVDLDKKQAHYYDVLLSLDGLLGGGLDFAAMYAYKGTAFGANKVGEDLAGVNLLGYASCAYLTDDIFGENRIPSADVISETGVKLTGYLYKKELTLDLVYIYGAGFPDQDLSQADTKYLYDHYGAQLNWYLLPSSVVYLGYEKLDLFNSDIEKAAEQLSEELIKIGLRFAF